MRKVRSRYLCLLCILAIAAFWVTWLYEKPEQTNETSAVRVLAKPQRIVSLSPGNTEILFALGAGERVVGVTSYCDYPAAAKTKPTIGGFYNPDVEKIVALAPDIVFAAGEIQSQYIRSLERAGIRVVSVEPRTMQEVLNAIDAISEAIGEREQGQALHASLAAKLDEIRRLTAQTAKTRVFLQVWDAPLLTVGGKSYISDIVSQAGGVNVAGDKDVDYTPCDFETLYAYNPETYIIISHTPDDNRSLVVRPELSAITAIKEQRVYHIIDNMILRPGPRSFTGLVQLAGLLHPEVMRNWQER